MTLIHSFILQLKCHSYRVVTIHICKDERCTSPIYFVDVYITFNYKTLRLYRMNSADHWNTTSVDTQ